MTSAAVSPINLASDNAAGAHPAILDAIVRANAGRALAYGEDELSQRAAQTVGAHFGDHARVLFVFGGTGGNLVALGPAVRPYASVLCADTSHLWCDEGGAPERFLGCKLQPIPSAGGKLTVADVGRFSNSSGSQHGTVPAALSIAQPTEWGTLYSPDELRALAEHCHERDMILHVDGARLPNACAALGKPLAEVTADVGVDVVTLAGTKNGLLYGEAVVFLSDRFDERVVHARKQASQLPSKMRFVAAQFEAAYGTDLWRECAGHANAMAARLGEGVERLSGAKLAAPVEVNAVFASLPAGAIAALLREHIFHVWDGEQGVVRWMTAFDSTEEEIDSFLADVARALADA